MKRIVALLMMLLMMAGMVPAAYAYEGYNGYDGGISSGQETGRTSFKYQEVSFLSGAPVVFDGTVILKKSAKTGAVTSTYTYTLFNNDRSASLKRTLTLTTTLDKKDGGQTVENTKVTKIAETVSIGDTTYVLKNTDGYDYSCTTLVDARPAVNFYSGNLLSTKVYQTGIGTGVASGGTVTVSSTGKIYGYDNYWGSSEAQEVNYTIVSKQIKNGKVISWGGTGKVALSASSIKKISYVKNEPSQISFSGGYVQTQYNSSIMEYSSKLPEFDSKGNATDNLLSRTGSLKLETSPVQTRLPVPDIEEIRGHWAEKDIELLSSLEILKSSDYLKPDQFITRAEFIAAMVKAAREVPTDPALATKVPTTARKPANQTVVSPFNDVSINNQYYTQIDSAVKRGMISGRTNALFSPNEGMTRADAITILIRSLGLEGLAPSTKAVTTFKDNDLIPSYARSSAYVAQKIGLLAADSKGYMNPNEKLTKAKVAALISSMLTYMQDGISKDYRDRFVNYK